MTRPTSFGPDRHDVGCVALVLGCAIVAIAACGALLKLGALIVGWAWGTAS